jgi:3-deoxy-D-manno-octulosonic-acid transferase
MHGASAGDVLALLPTVRELKTRVPAARVILTTMTNSGYAMASREPAVFDAVTYVPYDLPGSVRRALDRIRPDVLVLEYTELWPQLIRGADRRGIPLVLHNGRLSPSRIPGYRRLFFFAGNLLLRFRWLLMRDEREAEVAETLGADRTRIRITGNTKFDNLAKEPAADRLDDLRRATAVADGDLLWVAGSTHDGEEELLFDVLGNLRRRFPRLRLVVTPRYVERADRVAQLARRRGLSVRLRSADNPSATDVVVLDTIGELAACYHLATVVFVGGSFVERGGQNILEPAACGKPVLFGPHMHNFADSVGVLIGRGGIQVASVGHLERVMADLLSQSDKLAELGQLAREQVSRVRGAAARNADVIAALLLADAQEG